MNWIKYSVILFFIFLTSFILGKASSILIINIYFLEFNINTLYSALGFGILFILTMLFLGIGYTVLEKYYVWIMIGIFLLGFILSTYNIFNFTLYIIHGYVLYLVLGITLISNRFSFQADYNNQIKPKIGNAIYSSGKVLIFIIPLILTVSAFNLYTKTEYSDIVVDKVIDLTKPAVSEILKHQLNEVIENSLGTTDQLNINLNNIDASILKLLGNQGLDTESLIPSIDLTQNIDVDAVFSEHVEPIIESQIRSVLAPMQKYIPIFTSLSFYFFVTLITGISSFLIVPLGNTLISLLKSIRFLESEIEMVEVERLKL